MNFMRGFYCPIIYTFILMFSLNVLMAQSVIYEAENGTLSGSLKIEKSYPGYSSTGYVGRFENTGDYLTVNFSLDQSANYNVFIGYIGPFGDKINYVSVNGNNAEVSFPATNSFREVLSGKVRLKSGPNEIVISKSWGWFYVDYIRIEKNSEPETEFNISGQLVTPSPSNETLGLYKFLTDNFKKKIISGVMTLNSFDDSNWLKQKTGKEPALLDIDFMHTNRNYSWYDNITPVNDAKTWYARNGIPAMMWHWRDPSRKTEEFYTEKTTFDISKIIDPNSAEYKAMLNNIDFTATQLKILRDQHIPVLWRPLHEASGGWFWWGAKGPEPLKTLWRLMFDRMVKYHGLNNLIWVWTTDSKTDNMDWYPGDAYVDILGVDIYAQTGDFGSQIMQFNKIRDDFKGIKMVALSETGIIPSVSNLIADQSYWSWFMVWYGKYVEDGVYNPLIHWQTIMNHEYVITLDEMPVLSKYLSNNLVKSNQNYGNFSVFFNRENCSLAITGEFIKKPVHVSVFDITGKLVIIDFYNEKSQNIKLTDFKPGIYFVKLTSDEWTQTFKIVL